ncbi:MAG: porin family protein [Gammaproteobacteria bacterium]|nr:porin family protein [Gammaproteobacteria bacterium]
MEVKDGGLAEVPVQGGLSEVPVQMEERDGGLADVPVPVAMEAQVESDEQVDVNLRLHSSPYPYVGAVAARGGYDDTSGNHFGVKVGYMFSSRVGLELGYFQYNDTTSDFGGSLHDWSGFHLGPTWNFALSNPHSNILLNTSVAQIESAVALLFKFGYGYVWDNGLYLSAEVNAISNFGAGGLPLHYGIGFGYRFF